MAWINAKADENKGGERGMECPNCKASNPNDHRYCGLCGVGLTEEVVDVQAFIRTEFPRQIDRAIDAKLQAMTDRDVIEVKATEQVIDRTWKWIMRFASLISIPLVLVGTVLGYFGVNIYTTLKGMNAEVSGIYDNAVKLAEAKAAEAKAKAIEISLRIAEVDRQLREANETLEGVKRLQAEAEKTSSELMDQSTKIDDIVGQIKDVEAEVDGVKADVDTVKADVGTVKADVGSVKTDVGLVKADVGEVEKEIDTVKDEVEKVEEEIGVEKIESAVAE